MNIKYTLAGGAALALTIFFYALAVATGLSVLLLLAALTLILTIVAAVRAASTQTCPACRSTVPKGAAICRSCQSPVT